MTVKFRRPALRLLSVLAVLGLLTVTPACGMFKPRKATIPPPLVDCKEHAPAEVLPPVNGSSEDWRYWYERWLVAMGIATAEVQKRVTTARCLDALREAGVIR